MSTTTSTRLQQVRQRSRLGELLVSKGVISEAQLREAIARQQGSGQRLGEILTELNLATQRQIDSVLRKQKQLRLAAALVGALLGPVTAFAVPAPITTASSSSSSSTDNASAGSRQLAAGSASGGSLRALDDEEMSAVSAQGGITQEGLMALAKDAKDDSVRSLLKLMNPLLLAFDADTTMKNVVYDADSAKPVLNADGSITLRLPSTIGEIAINNIRVRGSDPNGPSFGSLTLTDIDLRGTTITIAPLRH
jgi:hypothetical protein